MRRLLPLLLVLVAACSSGGGGEPPPETVGGPTSVAPEADLPAELAAFLDAVGAPGDEPFEATYHVLRKLGGGEHDLEVVADPAGWTITIGDLVIVDGAKPATCSIAAQRCVGKVREDLLTPVGVFSRFFADAPAKALATDARRATADDPVFTGRTVAGVALRCAAVPQRGTTTATYCTTPEGIFGWVDTPAVRYELTGYEPGPSGRSTNVPFPIVANDDFLSEQP